MYQITQSEGRILFIAGVWVYEFEYRDHQNNLRVSFKADGNQLVQTQTQEQDPFGLEIKPLSSQNSVNSNQYKFLNRQDIPELNGVSDLVNRFYDKQIGRFWSADPVIEGQEHLSLYQYGWNNPILNTDPNGDCPNCITGAFGAWIGALIGVAIEAGTQLYNEGTVSDWRAVGGSALQGAVTGGAAGFTGGASILVTASVSAGANVVGGALNNTIQGKEITAKSVATDAAVGAVAGVGGKILDKAINKGIIYLCTDIAQNGLKPYVGQAKSAERFVARQGEHARANPNSRFQFKKIDSGRPGKNLDIKEQRALDARGGPTNKSNPNGGTSNKKNVIKKEES